MEALDRGRGSIIIGRVATIATCPSCGARNRLRPHATAVPRCARCKAPLPWLVDASADTFDEEVRAPVPVIVDFWAPWCGPCRMVSPALERLARERAGALKVVKLNVDEAPELAAEYRAMSIPLLVVMRDGEEVDRVVGALPPPELERRLAPVLGSVAS
jgi:thioredoxin 2